MYIDSPGDLQQYITNCSGKELSVVLLPSNTKTHFVKNNILSIYVYDGINEYVFPYKHQESLFSDYTVNDLLVGSTNLVYNKLLLDYAGIDTTNCCDLELVHYLNTSQTLQNQEFLPENFYSRLYAKFSKISELFSLTVFIKWSRSIIHSSITKKPEGIGFYNTLQKNLFCIEQNGLCVDLKYFTPLFGTPDNLVNDRVYTKYNMYTTTGRPSNRFNSINFAALPKQDDTRKCFISRFTEGVLVELDFKAYHPHIIAHMCDYSFGEDNVYEHLAKLYFETKTPTENQISKSKEFTFNQIYGGINKKYADIEFFAKTKKATSDIFSNYKKEGYYRSNISSRHFIVDDDDLIDTRLFNYVIQMTETELNSLFLNKVYSTIDTNYALPILYTYDSVVFDCKKEYVTDLINKLLHCTSKKYPITVKCGDNYKEMMTYNI